MSADQTVTTPAPLARIHPGRIALVIGIIAVLISLLLPALNSREDQANTVQCLSNLRQICAAITNYASDNQELWYRADMMLQPIQQAPASLNSKPGDHPRQQRIPPHAAASDFAEHDVGHFVRHFSLQMSRRPEQSQRHQRNARPQDPHRRQRRAFFTRLQSASTQVRVDTWYAINGWTTTPTSNEINAFARWPFTDLPVPRHRPRPETAQVYRLPEHAGLVLVFDGFDRRSRKHKMSIAATTTGRRQIC